jgi:hypothetical protein
MRRVAMLVLVAACHREPAPPPVGTPHANPAANDAPELQCPTPHPATWRQRGSGPQPGGYRVVDSDNELDAVRAAMASGTRVHSSAEQFRALSAVFDDMRDDIQQCMVDADGLHPELQYSVRTAIRGNSVATLVNDVTMERIDGVNADASPVLGKTAAEACVKALLHRVVLPPGDASGAELTVVRQDFCMPLVSIAMYGTRGYVDAYAKWWRVHRDRVCPIGLSDLDGYDQDQGKDPWRQPYAMRCDANGFEVISGGPDRRVGTADDIASHR